MECIKLAIVGCGAVVEQYYAPALLQMQEVDVAILFDPDPARLGALRKAFPNAKCITDFAQLIDSRPDATVVASPPRFHARQSIALLEAGSAVLCEKPMASTSEEAEAMLDAGDRAQAPLAIGLFRRFFPVNKMIRDIVSNQNLGRVKRFHLSEGSPFNWPAQSASFFQKSNSQGGVLADSGVHVLDLLLWWFGMPETIEYEDDAMGGLEANCVVRLQFEEGIEGTVRLSRDTQLKNQTLIQCERGWIRSAAAAADKLEIGFPESELSLEGSAIQRGGSEWEGARGLTYSQCFMQQLRQFLAASRGDGVVSVPASEGIKSLRTIEQCYRNRKLMKLPWLTDLEMIQAEAQSSASRSFL